MDRIRVDTQILESLKTRADECTDSVHQVSVELQKVLSTLPKCCEELCRQQLTDKVKALSAVETRGKNLSGGIRSAGNLFEECEKRLGSLYNGRDPGKEGINGSWSPNWNSPWLKWLDNLLDALNINEYGRDYTDPGSERQSARDALMQDEMSDIFQSRALNITAWHNASTEKKKEMVQQIVDEINRIQGTKITQPVNFFYEPPEDNMITMGYYQDSLKRVSINIYAMEHRSYSHVMDTIVHEMRHAYQHEVILRPGDFAVSEETAKSWDANFDNYISYDSNLDNFDEYQDQPVEADARGYASGVEYR